MGRRRMHAAFMLYKTLGYPELRYELGIMDFELGLRGEGLQRLSIHPTRLGEF